MKQKRIEVVAAIIKEDNQIFATQRGYGEFKDWWEFPGGKMEPGETQEEALIREVREELSVDLSVEEYLMTVEYDYPNFHLVLHCFICKIKNGEITLLEHKSAKWLKKEQLESVNWLPADFDIIDELKRRL